MPEDTFHVCPGTRSNVAKRKERKTDERCVLSRYDWPLRGTRVKRSMLPHLRQRITVRYGIGSSFAVLTCHVHHHIIRMYHHGNMHQERGRPSTSQPHIHPPPLSRRSLDLRRRALSSLLARNPTPRLSTSRLARRLGLLRLSCTLGRSLLLFPLLDGCLTGGGAGLGSLCASLFNHVERSSHDGALMLDRAAAALLCDFLQSAIRQYG